MTTRLMTNIDSYLYAFLDTESKKKSITKREFIEKIISEYIRNKKMNTIKQGYKNMGKDRDYLKEMQENTAYLGSI